MPGITLEHELELLMQKLEDLARQRPINIHSVRAKYVAVNGLTAEIGRIKRLIFERDNR